MFLQRHVIGHVVCANAIVKTNNYRLPINFYITFLPCNDLSISWSVNYLFQALTMFFRAVVFFAYFSTILIVFDHSCWAIDIVKILIEKLDASVGCDGVAPQQPRREMITKQIRVIHEKHFNALKWNNEVQQVIRFILLVEFSVLSVLICLCIYTIVSAYIVL